MEQDPENAGLELMVVLGENALGAEPSLQDCLDYATSHDADPARVFIDYGGAFGGWNQLFSNISTYSGGSLGLPWMAALRGRNMEYVASNKALNGYPNVKTAVQDLLTQ
jgi:hypothetical protein